MKNIIALIALSTVTASQTMASLVSTPSYTMTELSNSSGTFTTYAGLMKDGDTLYYGNFTAVRSYNLATSAYSKYASIVRNADTKALVKFGGSMYIAVDTSTRSPFPSNIGTFNSATGFTATMSSGTQNGETSYSIYDGTVFNGSYYFAANLATISDPQTGLTGTRIYRYNTVNPNSPFEVANIGGASGGIAFDTAGNLYYASQNEGEGILRFNSADVLAGGLNAANGTSIVAGKASNLGFLSNGKLLATMNLGKSLAAYDVDSGKKTKDIASTTGTSEYMGKFVVGEDDTIYVTSTNFGAYESSLSSIKVPEPSSVLLLGIGSLSIIFLRRNKANR